jgi:hypothetical protein
LTAKEQIFQEAFNLSWTFPFLLGNVSERLDASLKAKSF